MSTFALKSLGFARALAAVTALSGLSACTVDFPSRGRHSGDAEVDAEVDIEPLPIDSRALPADARPDARAPDARLDPDARVRDTGLPPPDGLTPDLGPTVERCNGVDDDGDGEVDEDGDAECLSRRTSVRFCLDGACKACNPDDNAGCTGTFRCLLDRSENVCAQCTPAANHCAEELPYCSPAELICLPCPEILTFGAGDSALRCRDAPFEGHCVYLFDLPPDRPSSCGGLCQAVGMGCSDGWYHEPQLGGAGELPVCLPGESVACESERLGALICDCIQ